MRRAGRRWVDLPIARKGFAVLLVALVPMFIAIGLEAHYSSSIRDLDDRLPVARQNRLDQTRLLKLVVDAETAVRGYLLTRDESFLGQYEGARDALAPVLARMKEHEEERGDPAAFATVAALVDRDLGILAGLVDSGPSEDEIRESRIVMDQIRGALGRFIAAEDRHIRELVAARESRQRQEAYAIVAAFAAGLIALIAAGRILLRGIVRRVQVVRANAQRLAEGEPLEPLPPANDEIGDLAQSLSRTASLLRARESALRQAKEEADRANTAKSEFLSRMSHELRTPLNAIMGFAELGRTETDGDVRSDLDQIHLAGRHLLDLVNEVLDISRIEVGQMSLSLEPVSVSEVVTEAIALVKGAADARSIQIRSRCDQTMHVQADRQRLKQVLLNLLSNGVKYNRNGGSVVVGCTLQQDCVRVAVSDTGPGLPEGSAEDLFTPFARLGAETSGIEGTGLGLALSKNLVEAMGGELDVGSTGSQGTEFWFTLAAAEDPGRSAADHVRDDLPAGGSSPAGAVVLQVEDNPANIKLVARIMQRRPAIELITAQLGAEALAIVKQEQPDLVLLDLNLPDMSGREVLGRLRSDPATRDVPVVMLSADATSSQIEELLRSGASDYLTKPIDVTGFLAAVDRALSTGAA